jgi:hypothetical protein
MRFTNGAPHSGQRSSSISGGGAASPMPAAFARFLKSGIWF